VGALNRHPHEFIDVEPGLGILSDADKLGEVRVPEGEQESGMDEIGLE
jgi:hypothetical protein